MEEKKNLYRLSTLMNCTIFDAFSAQKNAGSTSKYFELLLEFTRMVPLLSMDLTVPDNQGEMAGFLRAIDDLQKQLLAIGASSLLLDAERVAELARIRNQKKCAEELSVLKAKLKMVCGIINGARIDLSAEQKVDQNQSADAKPAVVEGEAAGKPNLAMENRPRSPLKSEPFEKLDLLIENFEVDEAMEMLGSIMAFSYNKIVDAALNAIYADLAHFNYEAADAELKRVLKIIREIEGDSVKAARKKILAVDDIPDVLHTVKSIFKDKYAVYGVTNYVAALKFLTGNSADLILLDIEMPEMDGFTLLSVIRKIKAYEKTPVFIISGNVNEENLKKAQAAGVNDFIRKPIDVPQFLPKIEEILG